MKKKVLIVSYEIVKFKC